MIPILQTPLGQLHQADCLDFLRGVASETVDLAFADPPFNLGKEYTSKIDDLRADADYIEWCQEWLTEMVRTVKPGGSLFLYNLPKWNIPLGNFLMQHLTFRHWVSVDIKYSLPINGRLYPAHYSLLYFNKGKRPNIFHPDRLPVPCCRHCGGELKDYGGYKDKMNPLGVNLSDVWYDIPPVRHAKYKKRGANALPLKLMDRIVTMASDPGSLVLDPFGGSGTTFIAAELTGRKWIGSELECSSIIDRFNNLEGDRDHIKDIHANKNRLFKDADIKRARLAGRPLSSNYRLLTAADNTDCCSTCDAVEADLFG